MRKAVEIRPMPEDDLVANEGILLHLLEENARVNFPWLEDTAELAGTWYRNMLRFAGDSSAILVGAFEGTSLVGFLWAHRRDVLGERRIHVGHIAVRSVERSRGIGTSLLSGLETIASQEGIEKLELMATAGNEDTVRFYEANGFAVARVQFEKALRPCPGAGGPSHDAETCAE